MAILTKKDILAKVKAGAMTFAPTLDTFQMQEHGVDLRIGFTFLIPRPARLTAEGREAVKVSPLTEGYGPENFETIELEEGQYFDILPNEQVLASSLEVVTLPADVMATLFPRSSINRRGMSIDSGVVSAGYAGQLIIPIRNHANQIIRVYPGERFCQLVFEELKEAAEVTKGSYHLKDLAEGEPKKKTAETRLVAKGAIRDLKTKHKQK